MKREQLEREEKVKAEELERKKQNTRQLDNGFLKLSPKERDDSTNELTEEEATVPVLVAPNKQKEKGSTVAVEHIVVVVDDQEEGVIDFIGDKGEEVVHPADSDEKIRAEDKKNRKLLLSQWSIKLRKKWRRCR